jgi:hypothetical protein
MGLYAPGIKRIELLAEKKAYSSLSLPNRTRSDYAWFTEAPGVQGNIQAIEQWYQSF